MEGKFLAMGLMLGSAVFAGPLGISLMAGRAFDAMARQPEQTNNIRMLLMIMTAFVEGIVLFAWLMSFLALVSK